ncbi:MAG TPA: alpha/beta hydrolase [Ruminococcaceae bacterium]|nr:alpha/beta hydrolase [Oscillospiraceae bacterium]
MKTVRFSPNPESGARVVGYLHDPMANEPEFTRRPCAVILPGGAYEFLSERESEPPAAAFFAHGYQVFILSYSVGDRAADLRPLIDASLTLIRIRESSAEWNVLPGKIAVCGFSAGGHVAAGLGTLWDSPELRARIDTKGGRNRPDAMVLCYAVLTAGRFAHRESIEKVSGGSPTPEQVHFFSLENHISPRTPPAFLWHTVEDDCVPVENALLFAAALQSRHIPFECHIYQKGGHGMSLCTREVGTPSPHCATWFPLCAGWLDGLFGFRA